MFTLDTDMQKERRRNRILYCLFTVFVFFFQLIYEYFSHGVKSNYMIFSFLIPLAGGFITDQSFKMTPKKRIYLFRQLTGGAVIWLTLGSIFRGVLEIYGTTNHRILVFAIAGALHGIAALFVLLPVKNKQINDKQ